MSETFGPDFITVTDEDGNEKLFRHCQSCEKWQAFEEE